jgi:hypothetical protein
MLAEDAAARQECVYLDADANAELKAEARCATTVTRITCAALLS